MTSSAIRLLERITTARAPDDRTLVWSSAAYARAAGGAMIRTTTRQTRSDTCDACVIETPDNPRGNLPRFSIVIGRVDPDSLRLVKSSVTVIEDRRPGETGKLFLSNFYAHEDRRNGEIRLYMSRPFARDRNPMGLGRLLLSHRGLNPRRQASHATTR